MGKSLKVKHILFLFVSIFIWGVGEKWVLAQENSGLGPLEIRDQFPVALPFLSMTPENTSTLEDGVLFVSYQLAIANTFLNSAGKDKKITKDEVKRGLVEADFYNLKTGRPIPGFHTYIDIESYRHLFRLKYGFFGSMEFALELAYVSFVGGILDIGSEVVHGIFGIDNYSAAGAYRAQSERNRYDYYILKEDRFLIKTNDSFENAASDPLLKFKWNLWEGDSLFPAVTFLLAYKLKTADRTKAQKLVSSGRADFGSSLLLSKAYGDWIVYLGWGSSQIGESEAFANRISTRFMTLEYQLGSDLSLVLQTMAQSSIFRTAGRIRGTPEEASSAFLSTSTELVALGYKQWFGDLFLETGFVEDYNQAGNQIDIVLFFEIGQRW